MHFQKKVILLFLFILFLYSCSTTKKIEEGRYLLSKNIIEEDGKKIRDSDAYKSIFQKPNKKSLIFPPIGLWFYNGSDSLLQKPLQKWFSDPERTEKTLDSLLIKDSLLDWISANRNMIRRYRMARNKLFVRNESLPVLVDSTDIHKSEKTLRNYYGSKEGFLNAKVSAETILRPAIKPNFSEKKKKRFRKKQKKATVVYHIEKGEPYVIDSLAYFIEDQKIDSIYRSTLEKSYLKKNQNFNEKTFLDEKDRIVKLLRNHGYYYFHPNNIRMEADSVTLGHRRLIGIVNIEPNPTDTLKQYNKIFKISKVKVITDHITRSYILPKKTPVTYKKYQILSYDSLKYKPRVFTDATIIAVDSTYRLDNDQLTKQNYSQLRNFYIPEIRYEKDTISKGDYLIANILLTPQKKYSLDINSDAFRSNYLTIGFSPNVSLLSRNIFGGAENLELSTKLTGGTVAQIDNTSGFALESSLRAKVSFPRFIIPFIKTEEIFTKEANKATNIGLSATWQNNIGIGKVEFSSLIDYTWNSSRMIKHRVKLSNIQYIRNFNKDRYFNLYTSDKNIRDKQYEDYFKFNPDSKNQYAKGTLNDNKLSVMIRKDSDFKNARFFNPIIYDDYFEMIQRQRRITEDVLINSSSYTFEYDGKRDKNKKNPFYFRGMIELAGNTLNLLDNLLNFTPTKNALIYKNSLLDVGYAQYVKFDFDLRKYWKMSRNAQFASRFLLGYTIPYGNASSAPFNKTYLAGGSEDIRAWQAYDLGPGESNRSERSFSTEQLKMTFNLEWRRKLSANLDGALFIDTGNIWATNSQASKESLFQLDTFYKQMAVGSGFGFRYNFGYNIVFRFDLAYKIHDPNQIKGERWFHHLKVWAPTFNIGIGYPF